MQKRLLEVYDQFTEHFKNAPRKLQFRPDLKFDDWKKAFREKIVELLKPFPEPVPLDLEVIEERKITKFDGKVPFTYIQQKIVYNTEQFASCIAYLLKPETLTSGKKYPAILVAHGHGAGKDQMVGLDPSTITKKNKIPNFEATAVHLVKEGFIVIAPDWRPFGERKLNAKYTRKGRDPCNITYLSFGYFGYHLLALNIYDAMRTIDVLQTLPFVDWSRIGMIGKSYGGTMTSYTTALDDRIKAAVISGYLSTLEDAFSMRGLGNYCGAQYMPGLLEWGDIPDVIGLIAPKPLLIEAGENDTCFAFDDATKAYNRLQEIYKASGAPDNLSRDTAPVGHSMIFKNAVPFFKRYLSL